MSTPESIVVSYEKALELQKAGFHQGWTGVGTSKSFSENPKSMKADIMGTYFKWFDVRSDYTKGEPVPQVESIYCNYPMIADAPTSEEILRRLPKEIGDCVLDVHYFPADGHGWRVCYAADMFDGPKMTHHTFSYDSATDALASMWIYLSKNNLLPKA